MKKVFLFFASMVIFWSSAVAFADDTTVTLGLKTWYSYWKESTDYLGGGSDSNSYGSAFLAGPSLNIKFGKPFIGATYLMSVQDHEVSDYLVPGDTMKFERKDLELTLGYLITKHFGMFIGYKTIEATERYTFVPSGYDNENAGTWRLKGPEIGILGNIPLSPSAAIYFNMALLRMEQEFEYPGGSTTSLFDMTGLSGEAGVAFSFSESLFANIGVKALAFTGDDDTGDTYTHTFYGPTLGLNYIF